jgi:hypothetical protein
MRTYKRWSASRRRPRLRRRFPGRGGYSRHPQLSHLYPAASLDHARPLLRWARAALGFPFSQNPNHAIKRDANVLARAFWNHVLGCGNRCRAPLIVQSIQDIRVERMAVLS